ncbi:MAG: hypothetical protein AB7V27_17560 [Candidatus Binatia bacterium]
MKDPAVAYVVTPSERTWFKRCRRAWDLGASMRQNYEPAQPMRDGDFANAIRQSLAVYYFPGMWDWSREIVRPLALAAFRQAFTHSTRVRDSECRLRPARGDHARETEAQLGEDMLAEYFRWAPALDRFSPIRVDTEFYVDVADPSAPAQTLMTATGDAVRYRGEIDLLVLDAANTYWLVEHRIRERAWEEMDQLLLDERALTNCWAWSEFFLGMKITGVMYNEWCRQVPAGESSRFRRVAIACSAAGLANACAQLGLEAREMIAPDLPTYPTPTHSNCSVCAFVEPCIAMHTGSDAAAILAAQYRQRRPSAGARWREDTRIRAALVQRAGGGDPEKGAA